MITTFTREETETASAPSQSTYSASRYGTLDNQISINDTPSYSGYSSYRDEEVQEEVTPSYELEREYPIDGIKEENEVIVPTFMPLVESRTKAEVQGQTNIKFKLNSRGKIFVSVFSIVACLLVAFSIYNAVVISRLNASLKQKEMDLVKLEQTVGESADIYNEVTSVNNVLTNLPGSYKEAGESVVINLKERPVIVEPPTETNWFDKICEFMSGLFN